MRFKRCRLFNSAHLFKDILGENWDLCIFLSSFSILISQQHGVSTFYILSVVKGECVFFVWFFLVVYIYILRWGLKKSVAFCGKQIMNTLDVFVKLPCMYSMHVNVVVQVLLQYI